MLKLLDFIYNSKMPLHIPIIVHVLLLQVISIFPVKFFLCFVQNSTFRDMNTLNYLSHIFEHYTAHEMIHLYERAQNNRIQSTLNF